MDHLFIGQVVYEALRVYYYVIYFLMIKVEAETNLCYAIMLLESRGDER